MKNQILWKSLTAGIRSQYDGSKWSIGEWRKEKPPESECVGLNASPRIIDAMSYVGMEVLARVEVSGKIIKGHNKWTCQEMRIVDAWEWTKEESVRLSIFAAELVIDNFEKEFPNDDRPRRAIEAAKYYIKHQNESAASAAASTAWNAAWSAESVWSAAWSTESAAWSTESAAESAERSAESAAWSVWSAAWSTERSAALDKIEEYLQSRVKYLNKIE